MNFSREEGYVTLKGQVTWLRQLVEKADSETIRRRTSDSPLSVHERIVGLFKYETDFLRPALAILLGQEMRRLPTFDLAERAVAGGYAAYNLGTLFVQWAEVRNISMAKIEALDESFLAMRGEMPDCPITLAELLDEWLAHETAQVELITASMAD